MFAFTLHTRRTLLCVFNIYSVITSCLSSSYIVYKIGNKTNNIIFLMNMYEFIRLKYNVCIIYLHYTFCQIIHIKVYKKINSYAPQSCKLTIKINNEIFHEI